MILISLTLLQSTTSFAPPQPVPCPSKRAARHQHLAALEAPAGSLLSLREPDLPANDLPGTTHLYSEAFVLPPAELTATDLWMSFGDAVHYLSDSDCQNLFACLHVLLESVSLSVRAVKLEALELRRGGMLDLEPSRALETLAVVSAVSTARDFLLLRLDTPTVAAALLSEVINDRTPTWPDSPLSDEFRLQVVDLLDQARRMRAFQTAVPDLNDASALAVRGALMAAVGDRTSDREGADGQVGGGANPRALLVLLGSSLTRLRAAKIRPAQDQQQLAVEAIQLYAPLAHTVGFGNAFSELETLAYAKLFPDSLRRLQRWYAHVWPDGDSLATQLQAQLEAQLMNAPSLEGMLQSVGVSARLKTVPSTFRKLLRTKQGERSIETVRDIIGLRVVLTPSADVAELLDSVLGRPVAEAEAEALLCHGAYRQVLMLWTQIPGRFKDFVTAPKPNGYQSIHANVRLADGRDVEIQIRTLAMHERATSGSASHEGYRATQLGGGLAPLQGTVRRTSLALRGVQVVHDDDAAASPVCVPMLPASKQASRRHDLAADQQCIDTEALVPRPERLTTRWRRRARRAARRARRANRDAAIVT